MLIKYNKKNWQQTLLPISMCNVEKQIVIPTRIIRVKWHQLQYPIECTYHQHYTE